MAPRRFDPACSYQPPRPVGRPRKAEPLANVETGDPGHNAGSTAIKERMETRQERSALVPRASAQGMGMERRLFDLDSHQSGPHPAGRVPVDQWPSGLFESVTDILAAMLADDYRERHLTTVTSPWGSDSKLSNALNFKD